MRAYTYLVKHKPSGKVYYGVRIKNDIDPTKDLFVKYFTSSKTIKELIAQDGIESFEWQVRREFDDELAAVTWEARVLQRCRVLEHQDRWLNKNAAGRKLLTKFGAKVISATHKGKPKSEEHREKIRQANLGKNKGKKRSEEHKQMMSEKMSGAGNPMFGKIHAEDTKRKIGKANKGKLAGEKNPFFGKTLPGTEAARIANTGKKHTAETIAKRVAKQRGKKRSEETRAKISAAATGRPRSPETLLKMSIAAKEAWERKKNTQ
jgi:hypothetical protein